jgi:mono/diheme cytochrome c family protein
MRAQPMKQSFLFTLLAMATIFLLAACGETFAPAPDPPTATPQTETVANLAEPDLARGQQLYLDKQCGACHGSLAEGGIGPRLSGAADSFDDFLHVLRTAQPPKPAFSETELTGQDVYNIYGWVQSLGQIETDSAELPALEPGELLGMTLWTEGRCDTCHGAFAQGSPNGPVLAHLSYPYELERAKMRQTADTIPEHAAEHMRDVILQRLYKWLQAGANPADGC